MSAVYRRAEMRIRPGALAENMRSFKGRMEGQCRVMAVVKADAYGHGAVLAARTFCKNGAEALAVAMPEEAIELREAGLRAPILVLGGVSEAGARACVRYNVAMALFDADTLAVMQDEARRLDIVAHAHIKIDTGMSRVGLRGDAALEDMLARLKDCRNVKAEGVFTHFADADGDREFTREQNARFCQAVRRVRAEGYRPVAHAAASVAALADPTLRHDMVRPGIALYGAAVRYLCPELTPAQTLAAYPVRVERIASGDTVGYGRTFRAERDSVIMTLPVGYGDGYPRALGGKAHVLVRGRRAPIVGRVCMDMLMADVTDIPGACMADEAVLLGAQGGERVTPDELAALAGTIPYEIMLGFHSRVPRKESEK